METNDSGTIDLTQIEINFQEQTKLRAQQTQSLIKPFVTFISGKGRENKTTFWGGQNAMGQKSQRFQSYPKFQTEREAYWFGTTHFWAKEYVDGDDELFDAADASTGLPQVWGATAARETDRQFINTAIGLAYKGRYGSNTAQPLPSGQFIAHGNTGLTEEKVRAGVAMLRRAHPEQLDPICTFLTSAQMYGDLMGEDKVVKGEYNGAAAPLRDLNLPFFLGTYFRLLDDYANFQVQNSANVVEYDPILPIFRDGLSSGNHIRYVVMWVKSAIRGKEDRPITTKLHDEEKDYGPGAKSFTIDMMLGGSRVDPTGIVVIECIETAPMDIAA